MSEEKPLQEGDDEDEEEEEEEKEEKASACPQLAPRGRLRLSTAVPERDERSKVGRERGMTAAALDASSAQERRHTRRSFPSGQTEQAAVLKAAAASAGCRLLTVSSSPHCAMVSCCSVTVADSVSSSLSGWLHQLHSLPQPQYSQHPLQLRRDLSSPARGYGVFAVSSIPRHSFTLEYAGQLITAATAASRECRYSALSPSPGCYMFYFQSAGNEWCIDATMIGEAEGSLRLGYGRYVNHSIKRANVYGKVLTVNARPHLCFFSKRQLQPAEELLIDYGDRSRQSRAAFPWLHE